jgi:hypothetical protein
MKDEPSERRERKWPKIFAENAEAAERKENDEI